MSSPYTCTGYIVWVLDGGDSRAGGRSDDSDAASVGSQPWSGANNGVKECRIVLHFHRIKWRRLWSL